MGRKVTVNIGDVYEIELTQNRYKGYLRIIGIDEMGHKLPYIELFMIKPQKEGYSIEELKQMKRKGKLVCFKECFKETNWKKYGNISVSENEENSSEVTTGVFPPMAIRKAYLTMLVEENIIGCKELKDSEVWGTGIFDSLTGIDVYYNFNEFLNETSSIKKATDIIVNELYLSSYYEDNIKVKLMYLVLAELQMGHGELLEETKKKALEVINDENNLKIWSVTDEILEQRKKVLEDLKNRLLNWKKD